MLSTQKFNNIALNNIVVSNTAVHNTAGEQHTSEETGCEHNHRRWTREQANNTTDELHSR
jgi:hypothetical protein